MDEWKYYNNALIPTTPPHISPSVPSKGFWKALKSSMCVGRLSENSDNLI